jgi:hypothetical protein
MWKHEVLIFIKITAQLILAHFHKTFNYNMVFNEYFFKLTTIK